MCLAIPVRVERVDSADTALVSAGGILRQVDTRLVDDLAIGDWVILHVGFALARLDEAEALETLRLIGEAGLLATAHDEIR